MNPFPFLRQLAANNRRDWFQAHKSEFERDVQRPMLEFIAAFAPRLKKISPRFVADPKPFGGSLMRIYRDTRFSKDKSPYKTHVAAHFTHASDGEAPGFYLHLAPGESFMGAGLWHPQPETTKKVRDAIVRSPARWRAAVRNLELDGDALSRPPRGYDPEHPLVEDLKRKDFITGFEYTEQQVRAADFLDRFTRDCARSAPLVRFLTEALGLKF